MNGSTSARRTRIRTRLLTGLFSILLLVAAVLSHLLWQQSSMLRDYDSLHQVVTLERYLLECRRQEKNFLLRQEQANIGLFQANLDSLINGTIHLQADIQDEMISAKLKLLSAKGLAYGTSFKILTADPRVPAEGNEIQRLTARTVKTARECHALMNEMRSITLARLSAACKATRIVNIATMVLGFLLSLVIVGWLTRRIAGPIEYLRGQAEKISVGDIQDMDVEFSDLDMARFRTRETYDLARSFQRMISSLRLTVSTERGMMDNYHMSIVVLVNHAFGPAGWAITERARTRAGFDSFADVKPSNVEEFITALQEETRDLALERRTELLSDAIRNLRR